MHRPLLQVTANVLERKTHRVFNRIFGNNQLFGNLLIRQAFIATELPDQFTLHRKPARKRNDG